MSGFDVDSYIQDHAEAPKDSGFDVDSYISDHAPKPGAFDGLAKSAIDSLPMLGGVAGGILGTPADAVAGPMGNIVGAGIGGYVGTAAKNLINRYYDPKSAPQTSTQAITQPVVGGVEQGLMQGTGEAVAPYIGKAIQGGANLVRWGSNKALSLALAVNADAINEYLSGSGRINAQPTEEALKEISDKTVGGLADDVDAKKSALGQAKDAFNSHQSDLKGSFNQATYDARNGVASAQQTLKDAHGARLQQMSGDVYDTINQLKSDVQSGSSQALKVLDKSDQMIRLKPIYEEINSQIERAQQAGTKEGMSLAQELTDYRDNLAQSVNRSGKINPVDAKRRIQGLDQITDYNPMAGSFDKTKNSAFKAIRSAFDGSVKEAIPEYAKAMEPVASDSALLNRVSDFGDKQRAVSLLQRINAPNQFESRAALQDLGKRYVTDFINGAQPESLPEHQFLTEAQAKLEALRPDRVSEKIEQLLSGSKQKATLDAAQSEYDTAQQSLAPYKSLAPNSAGQTMAQQKLSQLGKGGNVELERMFTGLGKLSNTDFVQAMKDRNVLAAFQKGATNGSRNTLMGATIGWAFGGMSGGAIGAGAGRVVDQWGPAITKRVLDGVIRVSKNPTVATISQLEIPESIKRNMIVGLENYLSKSGQIAEQGAARVADSQQEPNRAPAKGADVQSQHGLDQLGIKDDALSQRLLSDQKARQLLIQASGMAAGSKAMKKIMDQINTRWGKGQ